MWKSDRPLCAKRGLYYSAPLKDPHRAVFKRLQGAAEKSSPLKFFAVFSATV